MSRGILGGAVASVLLALFGVLFFFQYKDPMMLLFPVQLIVAVWVVVLIVHLLRHGVPVRIVDDERRER